MSTDINFGRLKPFINDPTFMESFKALLEFDLDIIHKNLESREGNDLYRLQGEAQALRKLLKLRERINGK